MPIESVRPTTLVGIKTLANDIKSEQGIKHRAALNLAAQAAGFQNYQHALNVLGKTPPTTKTARSAHSLFLTCYWKDRDDGEIYRETLAIMLSCPWAELATRQQLQIPRALVHFRVMAPDHLEREHMTHSQSSARRDVCAAARTLQFMDATKLRPSKSSSRIYPRGSARNAIPGLSHHSVWFDAAAKRYLLVDEPYLKSVEGQTAAREAWAVEHGFQLLQPTWPGMYAPDAGSRMYLVADADKGVALPPVAAALARLPEPIVEAAWTGESAPFAPYFVSPGALTRPAPKDPKPKTQRKPQGPRQTEGYLMTFVGPQRRPKARMPLQAHKQAGELLKSVVAATYYRKGVYNRVDWIRSELEEWAGREYQPSELPGDQFFDLYYHETDRTFERRMSEAERARHDRHLDEVRSILVRHYPDCAPLRTVLSKLEGAQKSLRTWG